MKNWKSVKRGNKSENTENSHPPINCPECNYKFDLADKQCPFCLTFFPEEEFKNKIQTMDDDLAFFEDLNFALTQNKPIFIHLDGANGLMKYLDARENKVSGKLE